MKQLTPDRLAAILPFPVSSPAYLLQWQESQQALRLADTVASLGFQKPTVGDLSPEQASVCRVIATHALRSLHPGWVGAAHEHAVNAAVDVLQSGLEARTVTTAVLAGYHAVMDGTLVLPMDVYLRIVQR